MIVGDLHEDWGFGSPQNGIYPVNFSMARGDFWILVNAYYDDDKDKFIKVNIEDTSFGIQMSLSKTLPGEEEIDSNNQCITIWRNSGTRLVPTNTKEIGDTVNGEWREFGLVKGWLNCLLFDSYSNQTTGSNGFEIDGIYPFRRVSQSWKDDKLFNGELVNAYHNLTGRDDINKNSYFWGIESNQERSGVQKLDNDDKFVLKKLDGGQSDDLKNWYNLLELSMDGNLAVDNKKVLKNEKVVELTSDEKTQSWNYLFEEKDGFTKDNCYIIASFITTEDGTYKQQFSPVVSMTEYGLSIWSEAEATKLKLVLGKY